MEFLRSISLYFILNLCLVFLIHFAIGDLLFFLSDYYSIFIYSGTISLLLLFFEIYFIIKHKRSYINIFVQFLILSFLVYYFVTHFFDFLFLQLKYFVFLISDFISINLKANKNLLIFLKPFKIYIEYLIIIFFIILLLFIVIKIIKNINKISFEIFDKQRQKRTEIFSILFFLVVNSLLFFHYINSNYFTEKTKPNKNIVVIVLDALSADLLRDYGNFNSKISFNNKYNASVYKNFRTLYPHTAHFFKFFYSGSPNVESFSNSLQQKKISLKKVQNENLLKSLQDKKILTRFHVYHRSAIPEGTDYGINDYRGLRSYYLTDKLNFIPELMNLDYHLINSTSNSISKKLQYEFQGNFRKLFVKDKNKKNDLVDLLLPELINLSKKKQSFFLLFHQRWNDVVSKSEFKNYYDPDENFDKKDVSYCRNANKILKKRDMTYDQKFEARCIADINKQKIAAARLLEIGIDDFISKMKQNKELDNVEIIITSDHGYMTAKNKLSYGFHNDELVVKVPLIIFNGKKEINSLNYFTLDLVSYILNNYNINYQNLYKNSVPLDSSVKRNFPTFSISRPGKYYKNWLVSYYIDNKKYEINIHKKGKAESKLYEINNFEQRLIKDKLTLKELENFHEILDLLGIEEKSINKKVFNN